MQFEHATTGVIVSDAPTETPIAEPTAPACTLLLPRNLASIAKCCSKDRVRFATDAVQLTRTEDGYSAVATDGRLLAMVEGPCDNPATYPPIPGLLAAPNSASTALVCAVDWVKSFRAMPKRSCKPILNNLAVVMGDNVTTLASTDLERDNVTTPRNVEGRFPRVKEVIPSKRPAASVSVNAEFLARVLSIASEFSEDGMNAVTLEIHRDGAPLKITSKNAEGQRFTGLVVPLTLEKRTAKHKDASMPDVLRTLAHLATVWYRAAGNYNSVLCQRCKAAHAALTAKYLS